MQIKTHTGSIPCCLFWYQGSSSYFALIRQMLELPQVLCVFFSITVQELENSGPAPQAGDLGAKVNCKNSAGTTVGHSMKHSI